VNDSKPASLQQLFRFSPDDVAVNRNGFPSRSQEDRLNARRRCVRRVLRVIGILWAAGIGGFLLSEARAFHAAGNPDWKGLVASAAIFVSSGLPLVYLGIRPMKPITVQTRSGPIRLARVQRTRRSGSTTHTYVATELHAGGEIFTIPDAAFALLEDGQSYAVHYWDRGHEILSIEKTSAGR